MPQLRHPRRERFCHEYLKIGIAAEAYRRAGYAAPARRTAVVNASKLLTCPDIRARLLEIGQKMTGKLHITLESLLREAHELQTAAAADKEYGAANQALTLKSRLAGYLVDRKEVGKPGEFGEAESADDVLEQVRKELGDDAAAALARAIGRDDAPAPDPEPIEPTHAAPGAPQ